LKTHLVLIFTIISIFLFTACNKEKEIPKNKRNIEQFLERNKKLSEKKEKELFFDSIFADIKNYKNDSLTREYYLQISNEYNNIEDYNKAQKIARKLNMLAIEAKDSNYIAKSFNLLATSNNNKNNTDSAYYYYSQAEKIYQKLKNSNYNLANILLSKSYIYYNIGEYALAETEAIRALRLYDKDSIIEIYTCYNSLGNTLDGLNNNLESIKYFKLALKEGDKFKANNIPQFTIDYYAASCYNNMGGVYEKMGDYDEAIKIYTQALEKKAVLKEKRALYAKLLNNLGSAKFKTGKKEEAASLYFKSLKIRDSLNNVSGIIASHIKIGEYYISKHDTARAINYITFAYNKAKSIQSHYDILNSLKLLSEIDKTKSTYYSGRYVKVSDSLQDIARQNRTKFARIEYETEKLEDEKAQLAKRNTTIIGISAIVILLVLAIFVIYYLNSKNKQLLLEQEQQKANEEIYQLMFEQQQKVDDARTEEKNRIAMELHDGILNNIYAVRLNLEFINKKTDEESIATRKSYIKELQGVESEIRTVSHELSRNAIINTDKNFESLLDFMISTQKNNFNTKFEADIDPDIDWENMSNIYKVNLYRIIQEGLQNINKYSQAKHATVHLSKENQNIIATIHDDGIGFDTAKTATGIGHKNLKKRTEALNGTITVQSAINRGTTITVTFAA
jgi:signal transduction histidine kinase/Flp pilus assembly protein TadD